MSNLRIWFNPAEDLFQEIDTHRPPDVEVYVRDGDEAYVYVQGMQEIWQRYGPTGSSWGYPFLWTDDDDDPDFRVERQAG